MIDIRDWRLEILKSKIHNPKSKILLITLLAFFLRVWQLEAVPPGWRDDELIETLVISQNILNGQWAFYYPDASGHEPLYHMGNALMLAMFGPTVPGIRWLSAILGTLTVPLLYVLGKRLFGERVGLVAAAALALSFWSLMYSRFGIRHIALPSFVLASFLFFWRGLDNPKSKIQNPKSKISNYLLSGLFLGLGFYTYFASRGVPLVLLAFAIYLALVDRPLLRQNWRGITLTLAVALLLAVPLVVTLRQQPELEARVSEVGRPLMEARAGNFRPLIENTVRTLNMFHSDGDDEWLYNIPFRPLFNPTGAAFFWSGVLIALYYALQPILRIVYSVFGRDFAIRNPQYASRFTFHVSRLTPHAPLASTFLLLWWLAGITPGFLSIPAGSLSHTIVAQPAVYLLAALPLLPLSRLKHGRWLATVAAVLLLATIALCDLPDYFSEWPNRGMTRFLYRADLHDVAGYLADHPSLADFAITGLLAGPWDREALKLELAEASVDPAAIRPRWYNPERAIFLQLAGETNPLAFTDYPVGLTPIHPDFLTPLLGEQAGGYALNQVRATAPTTAAEPVCFQNGLCWLAASYDPATGYLELTWRVGRPLDLPPIPLISNPPPPGVYAGPRLYVFGQLFDEQNNFLAGDDGLWVDPLTLYPGDVFIQQHRPVIPAGSQPTIASFGLYDPMTGERILTEDGREQISLPITELK